jgi:hypothetical protein
MPDIGRGMSGINPDLQLSEAMESDFLTAKERKERKGTLGLFLFVLSAYFAVKS